ncbi:MAG TPA: dihydrolipoamide acetyltransferase family protein [Trebonia sp.]|nr:dihydrolipoamide acetyltransferase family protein [Trebonia sp.]
MIEIKMPRLSDTMTEGAISTWHKHPGDPVAVGDVLVEIETDKAVMEFEAYQAGTLSKILAEEGQVVDIGTTIALLDDGSGASEPSAPSAPSPQGAAAAPPEPSPQGAAAAASSAPSGSRLLASPLVRKIAREKHLDLTGISGTGPGGRIIRADLSGLLANGAPDQAPAAAAASPAAPAAPAQAPAPAPDQAPAPGQAPASAPAQAPQPAADEARRSRSVPVSQVRRVIARRLAASAREIPHFYATAAADAEELMSLRAALNAQLTEAGRPKVSVNDLLIRAAALALREHPEVNVSYDDASTTMLMHDRINVGVAVAAESGLIVPVIRDADTKTVTQIGAEARELIALANERKLTPAQTSGGTFTISNLGMYGVEDFTAIINPPEAAILAVGATAREPAVVGDAIVPRYRLRYTLSCDHRVIDGALAAQFLKTLTGLIEHPWMIFA